jgi:1-deoxy-D-xylulose-5-phosphate synthase
VLFIAYGPRVYAALEAAAELESRHGLTATVVNARFAKPLDRALFTREIPLHRLICTVEDHALQGGFGAAVIEMMHDEGITTAAVERFGVGDAFVPHATQDEQYAENGYDAASMAARIASALKVPLRRLK